MRCERLSKWILLFLFVAACNRERPAPPPSPETTPQPAQTAVTTSSNAAPELLPSSGSYEEGLLWLKSAPAFRFVIVEGGVRAEGTMTRKTVGAEAVEFRANQETWRARSGPDGVTWEKRTGDAWKTMPAPDYGNRLYQRVTLAIDPAKREGTAQLVGREGASNHYRFTDANLGLVHEVWVSTVDNHVERILIGNAMEMTIQP
jgi:hypothetical protein